MKFIDLIRSFFKPKNTTLRNPEDWFREWLTGSASPSGMTVNQHTALKCAVVFACVRNIADDEAKLPLILYQRLDAGGKERAVSNPLYGILHDSPNKEMTAFTFRRSVTKDAALCGNGFAEIVRNGAGVVESLHYIESWRVTPDRDEAGNLMYKVYNGPREEIRLRRDQMLHIQGLGDGVVGYKTYKIAGDAIGACMAADQYSGSFFSNDATPSFFLKHPAKLSPEAYKNLKESWETAHRGVDNAHKVAILEETMEVLKLSIDPNVAQMVESRQYGVEDICRYFRMPPHKVQHLLRSTYSNIEQQSLEYVQDTLMSWLVCWEQEIWFKLVPMSRRKELWAEHLVDGLQRGDQTARSAFAREMFNISATNANEIRARENLDPIPGGEIHWVNATMIPADLQAENARLKNEQIVAETEKIRKEAENVGKVQPAQDPAMDAAWQQHLADIKALELTLSNREGAVVTREQLAAAKEADLDAKERAVLCNNLKAVEPAAVAVLREKIEKSLATEAHHVERIAKKPNAGEKIGDFYSDQKAYLTSTLEPAFTMVAHSIWMALAKGPISSTLHGEIVTQVTMFARDHVASSAATAEFTAERAQQEAEYVVNRLKERIETFDGAKP